MRAELVYDETMARRAAVVLVVCAACSFRLPGTGNGTTVDGAPADSVDAPPQDGDRAFDPAADCPPGYTLALPSTMATSRYRVIDTAVLAWDGFAMCEAEDAAIAHAMSIGSMTELTELTAAVGTAVQIRFYIGGVQDPTATTPGALWVNFDGTTLLDGAWYTPEAEPNDLDDGDETDHEQQLLIIDKTLLYLHDAVGNTPYGAICECDGAAVAASARGFVDADPNKP